MVPPNVRQASDGSVTVVVVAAGSVPGTAVRNAGIASTTGGSMYVVRA